MIRCLAALIAFGGCTGSIVAPSSTDLGVHHPMPGGGSGGGVEEVTPSACAAAPTAAPARLIRLSQPELLNAFAAVAGTVGGAAASGLEPDTRLNGFSSNADQKVGDAFVETLHRIADPVATQIVSQGVFTGCAVTLAKAAACAKTFITDTASAAWRRPATADELSDLIGLYGLGRDVETTATDAQRLTQGVQWAVRAIVQSPNFVYRTELGSSTEGTLAIDPYEVASALSFAVLAKPPDGPLLAAAAADELRTPDQRLAQVRRLTLADVESWRARQRRFALEWAEIDLNSGAWAKQPAAYPLFTPALKDAIGQSASAFVDDWLDHGSTLASWFDGEHAFINKTNAPLYGLTSTSETFVKTVVTAQKRHGVLTLPAFLGSHSDPDASSPVLRGSTILRRFLCVNLPSIPANVPPLPPRTMSTAKTTRERFDMHTSAAACAGCHGIIDPAGNPLENFDALGVYRTTENDVSIDPSGGFVTTPSSDQPLSGVDALSAALLASADAEWCVATQRLRSLQGRKEVAATDACVLERAAQSLHDSGSAWSAFETLVADESFTTRQFTKGAP